MPRIRDCLIESKNQHGNTRYQFQRGSRGPKFTIHGLPGEPRFESRYSDLLAGADEIEARKRSRSGRILKNGVPETVGELIEHHDQQLAKRVSQDELSEATREHYSRLLRKAGGLLGDATIGTIETHQLRAFIDQQSTSKHSFNNMLRAIKSLFKYGNEYHGLIDPAAALKKKKVTTDGFPPWYDDDIKRFFSTHKRGTKAHLALMLLIHVSPRRKDLVRLGPNNLVRRGEDWVIRFTPDKSKRATGVVVEVPAHPDLLSAISAMKSNTETFLARDDGHPYVPGTIGNYIQRWREQAGIQTGVSAHGTRHTRGIDLAENEATEYEIMACLGHTSPRATIRYTKEAKRRKQAMNGTKKSTLFDRVSDWTNEED
ncbi:site-specific integrase [Tropicibacter sp. Alg240-R139]|uniref:tyrosine-type recombinase/integrase n=1 Tax=Tropicibacter sp. Alg240-R139 TaxID=2305991 RepID=UPI0013E0E62A|nr:site-specific integrase [Tropicibacter sp. Alg240-R139]